MAYDGMLANRVRQVLKGRGKVSEKRMFGGLAFMLGDKMCCGVLNNDLVARIGPEAYAWALDEPHVRPMDFTGRPLKGYVYVGPQATCKDRSLNAWVDRVHVFAVTGEAAQSAVSKDPPFHSPLWNLAKRLLFLPKCSRASTTHGRPPDSNPTPAPAPPDWRFAHRDA